MSRCSTVRGVPFRCGFTLIELLVVISIIVVLAAILFPVFAQARKKAQQSQCLNNMKNLSGAIQQYTQDYDERFPFYRTPCWVAAAPAAVNATYQALGFAGAGAWYEVLEPYAVNWDIFRCPSSLFEWQWNANCYPVTQALKQTPSQWVWRINRRVHYGFNEAIFNDWDGYTRLARIRDVTNMVILTDNWNNFLAPWSRSRFAGINPRIAFANAEAGSTCDFLGSWRGCPTTSVDEILNLFGGDRTLESFSRHQGGSILTFADGHVKWRRWQDIKSKHRGGALALNWWRPATHCILGGGSDDRMPQHNDTVP